MRIGKTGGYNSTCFCRSRVLGKMHAVKEVGIDHTVDGDGNAFEELETMLAVKGRDLAKSADLKMLGDSRLFDDSKIEVVCLGDRFDTDGTRMITLNYGRQRCESESRSDES